MSNAGLDGGVFFGRDETTGREADLPRLLALLDACGVQRALAAAHRAIWFDDREGNATMREALLVDGKLQDVVYWSISALERRAGEL